MRTLASFCEEHGGAQHVPTIQALRSQRKKFQRSHGACDERVSDSLLLWKRFVASIAFDKNKLDAAPLFEMFSVTINELAPSRRQEPDAPPHLFACVQGISPSHRVLEEHTHIWIWSSLLRRLLEGEPCTVLQETVSPLT